MKKLKCLLPVIAVTLVCLGSSGCASLGDAIAGTVINSTAAAIAGGGKRESMYDEMLREHAENWRREDNWRY